MVPRASSTGMSGSSSPRYAISSVPPLIPERSVRTRTCPSSGSGTSTSITSTVRGAANRTPLAFTDRALVPSPTPEPDARPLGPGGGPGPRHPGLRAGRPRATAAPGPRGTRRPRGRRPPAPIPKGLGQHHGSSGPKDPGRLPSEPVDLLKVSHHAQGPHMVDGLVRDREGAGGARHEGHIETVRPPAGLRPHPHPEVDADHPSAGPPGP